MKISFITTVYNEEKTIKKLLGSIFRQTKKPHEIIIVDGGSVDKTLKKIDDYRLKIKEFKTKLKLIIKSGNRSVGRNEAIKESTGDIIVTSDAGCSLDKNWIKNITEPFKNSDVDVVAGFYEPVSTSVFQKALATYTCVMRGKVNKETFLPSSRSVAFRKKAWGKVKGYPEYLNTCEDLVFAKKLKEKGMKFVFASNAMVYWPQRKNLASAFVQFLNYAIGDGMAGYFRSQTPLLYARYILGFYFLFLTVLYKSLAGFYVLLGGLTVYLLWSIIKNYKYVRNKKAFFILPLIQLTSDFAVLAGTTFGSILRGTRFNFVNFFKNNKFLFFTLSLYLLIELSTLRWGVPNKNHPFPYFMDEWHQLNAVRATFAYGTPNIAGAANGTMFHFILSGLYLVPFTLSGWIDPAVIKINDFIMRERIFDLLRLNTLFWGVLSIFLVYKIADYIKASKKLTVCLFVFNPIWLMLSGYFKYDIALVFWILLSLFFFFRYIKSPSSTNYIAAAIPPALAVSVKISAVPLLLIYILLFLMFGKIKNIRHLLFGVIIFVFAVLFFGMPDTIFGKGNISDYLYDNIVRTPALTQNFRLDIPPYLYMFLVNYPHIFGYGLMTLAVLSVIYFISLILKISPKSVFTKQKQLLFVIISLIIFIISILPLRMFGGGNRSLVLLPFIVLLISSVYKQAEVISKTRYIAIIFVCFAFASQVYQSFAWLYIKYKDSPQETASIWIIKNIPIETTIGIENIPIYQFEPDVIEREFYYQEYRIGEKNDYKYQVVDYETFRLPKTVIITNDKIESVIFSDSSKKRLFERIRKEKYRRLAEFTPDLKYYKTFGSEKDFYFSGLLVATPVSIAIFEK